MTAEQIRLKNAGSTPTYAYLKYVYKYPEAAYPDRSLIDANATRANGL